VTLILLVNGVRGEVGSFLGMMKTGRLLFKVTML